MHHHIFCGSEVKRWQPMASVMLGSSTKTYENEGCSAAETGQAPSLLEFFLGMTARLKPRTFKTKPHYAAPHHDLFGI